MSANTRPVGSYTVVHRWVGGGSASLPGGSVTRTGDIADDELSLTAHDGEDDYYTYEFSEWTFTASTPGAERAVTAEDDTITIDNQRGDYTPGSVDIVGLWVRTPKLYSITTSVREGEGTTTGDGDFAPALSPSRTVEAIPAAGWEFDHWIRSYVNPFGQVVEDRYNSNPDTRNYNTPTNYEWRAYFLPERNGRLLYSPAAAGRLIRDSGGDLLYW